MGDKSKHFNRPVIFLLLITGASLFCAVFLIVYQSTTENCRPTDQCYNGGSFIHGNNTCSCAKGYDGPRCEFNTQICHIGQWSEWTTCSKTCGPGGIQFRSRENECSDSQQTYEQKVCNVRCYHGGVLSNIREESICQSGYSGECCEIQDCEVTPWSEWSTCTQVCGHQGTRFRTRNVEKPSACGGAPCPGNFTEEEECNRKCDNNGTLDDKVEKCRCPDGYNGQCCECKIQDCVMTPWSQWSTCTQVCGPHGTRFRTRNVDKSPVCGGAPCPGNFTEEEGCNRKCDNNGTLDDKVEKCRCPGGYNGQCCECKIQGCVMTPWSQWSTCTQVCGPQGTRFRTRNVDKSPVCGGAPCPGNFTEEEGCNRKCDNNGTLDDKVEKCRCPGGYNGQCCECKIQDCVMTPWSEWSTCSHTCGPRGTTFRTRDVYTAPMCGGTECSKIFTEKRECNRECDNNGTIDNNGGKCRCPTGYTGQCCECRIQDCVMTPWNDWSACTRVCGPQGTRFRIREVAMQPACGGDPCFGILTDEEDCNRECYNNGILDKVDKCTCPAGYNGQCCECKIQDCVMTPWSEWSACSHTCGPHGMAIRTRDVQSSPQCGGTQCSGIFTDQKPCNRMCHNEGILDYDANACRCPVGFSGQCCQCGNVDCELSNWTEWSKCKDATHQIRSRDVKRYHECGGHACNGSLTEARSCDVVLEHRLLLPTWLVTILSTYSVLLTCFVGVVYISSMMVDKSRNIYRSVLILLCFLLLSAGAFIFCGVYHYILYVSTIEHCNDQCYNGGSFIQETNTCACAKGYGGPCCEFKTQMCQIGQWSEWTPCTKRCGPGGIQFRSRENDCFDSQQTYEQRACNVYCYHGGILSNVPEKCICETGYSGECCECEIRDCEMTPWSEWSICTQVCGPQGTRFRTRNVDKPPACGGVPCPGILTEEEECNKKCYNNGTLDDKVDKCRCPDGYNGQCCECKIQDCVMTPWSEWSTCSHTCGPRGTTFRTRDVYTAPMCGGTECSNVITEKRECNRECDNKGTIDNEGDKCRCPVGYTGQCCECRIQDCVMTPWADWSACTRACGPQGTRFRIRNMAMQPACGGDPCFGILTDEEECNRECYNSGILDDKSDKCTCPAGYNGQCCECEIQDCVMTPWSNWSACSHTCGPHGMAIRTRDVQSPPQCGGTECSGIFTDQKPCDRVCHNEGILDYDAGECKCPDGFSGQCCQCENVDCELSNWTEWSTCKNATRQIRSRDVKRYHECAGHVCKGSLTEARSCDIALKHKWLVSKWFVVTLNTYSVLLTFIFACVVYFRWRRRR
ncbi:neurogenic locus notch homolog protein 1-like [Anneissia japonica]|uniref:neurogenic locus notch homolog protein 1-like n=1 Tax=Anneissia japonica TaxID=1529436 RepID=UPI0014256489|nr:neurogenic locus notch homolog protein 1-like [Anneissia japonica]